MPEQSFLEKIAQMLLMKKKQEQVAQPAMPGIQPPGNPWDVPMAPPPDLGAAMPAPMPAPMPTPTPTPTPAAQPVDETSAIIEKLMRRNKELESLYGSAAGQ